MTMTTPKRDRIIVSTLPSGAEQVLISCPVPGVDPDVECWAARADVDAGRYTARLFTRKEATAWLNSQTT